MKILRQHAHLGVEFDWLAGDRFERCVYLSTAGFGWIPESINSATYPLTVLGLILGMPYRGKAIVHSDQGASTDWADAAERGFYSFDWDHASSSYRLVAEPSVPVLKAQLPVEIMNVLGRVHVEMNLGAKVLESRTGS